MNCFCYCCCRLQCQALEMMVIYSAQCTEHQKRAVATAQEGERTDKSTSVRAREKLLSGYITLPRSALDWQSEWQQESAEAATEAAVTSIIGTGDANRCRRRRCCCTALRRHSLTHSTTTTATIGGGGGGGGVCGCHRTETKKDREQTDHLVVAPAAAAHGHTAPIGRQSPCCCRCKVLLS